MNLYHFIAYRNSHIRADSIYSNPVANCIFPVFVSAVIADLELFIV